MATAYDMNRGGVTPPTVRPFKIIDYVALALTIIGGLNWGLVGLFQFDLVATIFGSMTVITRVIYVLVGIAAAYSISLLFRTPRA